MKNGTDHGLLIDALIAAQDGNGDWLRESTRQRKKALAYKVL